jgi:hypothetical protein
LRFRTCPPNGRWISWILADSRWYDASRRRPRPGSGHRIGRVWIAFAEVGVVVWRLKIGYTERLAVDLRAIANLVSDAGLTPSTRMIALSLANVVITGRR